MICDNSWSIRGDLCENTDCRFRMLPPRLSFGETVSGVFWTAVGLPLDSRWIAECTETQCVRNCLSQQVRWKLLDSYLKVGCGGAFLIRSNFNC